jgi:hypothetical protein
LTTDFSTLTLDGQNNTDAIWIFQTKTTLMTGSRSIIILKNGAQYKNVFWAIGTAGILTFNSYFNVYYIISAFNYLFKSFNFISNCF